MTFWANPIAGPEKRYTSRRCKLSSRNSRPASLKITPPPKKSEDQCRPLSSKKPPPNRKMTTPVWNLLLLRSTYPRKNKVQRSVTRGKIGTFNQPLTRGIMSKLRLSSFKQHNTRSMTKAHHLTTLSRWPATVTTVTGSSVQIAWSISQEIGSGSLSSTSSNA